MRHATPFARIENWWFAPRSVLPLAGARIVFASVLGIAYVLRWPMRQDLFGPNGIGGAALYERVPDLPAFHPGILPLLDLLRAVHAPDAIAALYAILLGSLCAFAVGWHTRLAGLAVFALHLLFWTRNPLAFAGWAGWLNGPLLYVALGPSGQRLSIDAWLRRRRGRDVGSMAPGWSLRLLQIHVCAMYAFAGWSRLDKPDWLAGDLVRIAMTSAVSSRLAIDWSAFAPLLAVANWAALVLEGLAPFLLWVPRVGRVWAAALVLLHLGLALLLHMEVWAWSGVMIGGLMAFLLDATPPAETPTR
jgi:hypothetical protein